MRFLLGRKRRAEARFFDAVPVRACVARPDKRVSMLREGVIENLTTHGASFRSAKPVDKGWLVDMRLPLRDQEVRVTGRIVRRTQRKTEYGPAFEHGIEFGALDLDTTEAIALHCVTPEESASPDTSPNTSPGASRALGESGTASEHTVGLPVLVSTDAEGRWVDAGMGTLASVVPTGVQVVLDRPLTVGTSLRAQVAEALPTIAGRVGHVRGVDTRLGARFVTTIDTRNATNDSAIGEINNHLLRQPEYVTMNARATLPQDTRPVPSIPTLLTINGGRARIEGSFDVEESIEVQCEVAGNLRVGGTLVIGERGTVSADVSTVNAVIRGTYTGNLKATGSVEIATSGRVTGTIESSELVIAKGAVFTGSVTHVEQSPADQVASALMATVLQSKVTDVERQIAITPLAERPSTDIGPAAH